MTIQEKNKLIALFMGGVAKEFDTPPSLQRQYGKEVVRVSFNPDDAFSWYFPDGFKYHTSWDWLMPVVDKIEHLFETTTQLPRFEINSHVAYFAVFPSGEPYVRWYAGCYSESPEKVKFNSKIEAVYYVCVEFIKWYNEQICTH